MASCATSAERVPAITCGAATVTRALRWIVPAKIACSSRRCCPLARIVLFGVTDRLGANPIEFITRSPATGRSYFCASRSPSRRCAG